MVSSLCAGARCRFLTSRRNHSSVGADRALAVPSHSFSPNSYLRVFPDIPVCIKVRSIALARDPRTHPPLSPLLEPRKANLSFGFRRVTRRVWAKAKDPLSSGLVGESGRGPPQPGVGKLNAVPLASARAESPFAELAPVALSSRLAVPTFDPRLLMPVSSRHSSTPPSDDMV